MFYVLITGYRAMSSAKPVIDKLNELYAIHRENMMVIHGDCPNTGLPGERIFDSADTVAKNWSIHNEVPYLSFPARWKAQGKKAGPIRNNRMATWLHNVLVHEEEEYHLSTDWYKCLAFLHPKSRGTVDCIEQLKNANLEVEIINVR